MTATLLHDLLDDRVAHQPTGIALTRAQTSVSYLRLAELSVAAAGWLHGSGVGRGDRVLILGNNDAEIIPLIFAVSRLGALYVVLSDQIRPFHLRHIVLDSTPSAIIGTPEAVELLATLSDEVGCTPVHLLRDVPTEVDQPLPEAPPCLSIDPVSLIYTSGSTAMPKAVVSTHAQVLFATRAIQGRLCYRADDRVFCCLPLSFDYGLYQIFLSCLAGARLILGDQADAGPPLLTRLLDDEITVLPMVPSLAVTLARLLERSPNRPSRLRMVTNTGAALTDAVSARLRSLIPDLDVIAMFGLTECKRIAVAEPNLYLTRPGSVGLPLPDTEVSIVSDDGESLPAGQIGELTVRGPNVMAGYWNAPEQTALRYRSDGFGHQTLFTGDRCRMDADGYLYFVGRDDDIFKQRGVRVSATEIEGAAMDIDGVGLAAALPPADGYESRLAVSGNITPERLYKELGTRLEEKKMPTVCRVVTALPLSVNGKIDKKALRAEWDQNQVEATA